MKIIMTTNKALLDKIFLSNLKNVQMPSARGKPYPPFNPLYINEKNLPDNIRAKYVDTLNATIIENTPKIGYNFTWISYEDFDRTDFDELLKEINRCVEYNLAFHGVDLYQVPGNCITLIVTATPIHSTEIMFGENLYYEPDSIIESFENKEKYYYGFIGGDAGNDFNGDYFEIIRNDDNTFSWQDCELTRSSGNKTFKSRRLAKADAIKTLKPDDGSKFIVSQDPDEIYNQVYPDQDNIDIPEDIL